MKIYIKAILVIIVLLTAFWLVFSKYGLFRSDKRFAYSNVSQITKITISEDALMTQLENFQGNWFINGKEKVNSDMIENLKIIISKIKIEYPIPKIYHDIIDSLIDDHGIKIQLYKKNSLKRSYSLLFSDSLGCIGKLEGALQSYCLYIPGISINLSKYVSASPTFWLDNIAFSYYPSDILSVEVYNTKNPNQSFKIEHNSDNKYKLFNIYESNYVNNNKIDTLIIKRYLTYFSNITFKNYANVPESIKNEILSSKYLYSITIATKKEIKQYKIVPIPIYNAFDIYGNPLEYDRQNFYLVCNNKSDIFIASWITFDILLKNLSDFVNK